MNHRQSTLIGIGAVVAIGLIRATVLYQPLSPSGIDGGNWLAYGTVSRPGVVYPPLVPVAFSALVALLGAPAATAVAGTAAAIAPALAVLAALSWAGLAGFGALAAVALAASSPMGEVAAWGGYPQPIAMALAVVALVAAARWLRDGGWRALATLLPAFAGVVATSHLVAIPAATTALVLIGVAWRRTGRLAVPRVRAAALALAVPLLLLAGVYASLVANSGTLNGAGIDDAERILGFAWPVYFLVLLVLPLAFIVVRGRGSRDEGPAATQLAVLSAAAAAGLVWIVAYAISGEARLLYDIEVIAFLGVAVAAPSLVTATSVSSVRYALAMAAAVALVVAVATGMAAFPGQVAYYHVLTPNRYLAIEWLVEHPASHADSLVVADIAGVPLGWWVEGLARQEVLYASDLRWLLFHEERTRAMEANAFLYGDGFPGSASIAAARKLGIDYVYLPSAGAFGIQPAQPPTGWRVAFFSGDAVILAVESTAQVPGHA